MQEKTMTEILITGATGSTGGATAQALAAQGVPFRAMSRRADARPPAGGDVVQADVDDPDTLARALEGVRSAYLVTPSTERAETQQKSFIDAAVTAGVEHVVLLSQFSATHDSPVRFLRYHAAVEDHLTASGLAATILRPNLFMQGLLLFSQQLGAGTLPAPIGDAAVSAVDVRDIGEVAAAALSGEPRGVLTLTGPAALTHTQMAAELSRATGTTVGFVDIDPQDFADALRAAVPDWQVDGLVEDYAHYRAGEASEISSDIATVLGRGPRSFAEFAAEVAAPALAGR